MSATTEITKSNRIEDRLVREQARTFLTRVRRDSCYKTLRSLVTLLAAFVASGGFVMIAVAIRALAMLPGSQTEALEIWAFQWRLTFLSALYLLLSGLFTIALSIALRQAALALVDVADMMIDRGRKQWQFGEPPQPDK
jgi:hypothetical protein